MHGQPVSPCKRKKYNAHVLLVQEEVPGGVGVGAAGDDCVPSVLMGGEEGSCEGEDCKEGSA